MENEKQLEVRFKLGDYFHQGSHKVAISLPELTAQTNSFSVKNRPGCAPSLLKSNPKELYLAYNVRCNLKTSDPAGHDVKVHFDLSQVTNETTAKNLDVAVSCSCPAFLYWGGQWNSYQRDALEGEPRPLLTKPTERLDLRAGFVICKHIKAVSERILPSVQHNIVKILRKREVEEKTKEVPAGKPSLQQRQEEMRERMRNRKSPKKQDEIRKKLEEGIRKREENTAPVVERDTPATPEEKQRVPVVQPDTTTLPDDRTLAPIPELDDETTPAPKPTVQPTPQKMPVMTPRDRQQMQTLVDEDLKRQQREDQRRLDRQNQVKLRNNRR